MRKTKQVVRLNESQLRQIVKESVKRVLNERYYCPAHHDDADDEVTMDVELISDLQEILECLNARIPFEFYQLDALDGSEGWKLSRSTKQWAVDNSCDLGDLEEGKTTLRTDFGKFNIHWYILYDNLDAIGPTIELNFNGGGTQLADYVDKCLSKLRFRYNIERAKYALRVTVDTGL